MRARFTPAVTSEHKSSQCNAIEERNPCMVTTACTIQTIIEDPLLAILKEDSNITKPSRQIRRPGLDHNPTSPRFKLLMIDLIPNPEINVFFNIRPYFRRTLRLFLRKKVFQSLFSFKKVYPVHPSFCKQNLMTFLGPAYRPRFRPRSGQASR